MLETANAVVPHAGTWIEIKCRKVTGEILDVVPHAGTWIEILPVNYNTEISLVVPHAGTWIEIATEKESW